MSSHDIDLDMDLEMDLDMNLLSSPIPPSRRDGPGRIGGKIGGVPEMNSDPGSPENRLEDNGPERGTLESFSGALDGTRRGDDRIARPATDSDMDLDMNLLGSPVSPARRGGHGRNVEGGGEIGRVREMTSVPGTPEGRLENDGAKIGALDSFSTSLDDARRGDDADDRPAPAATAGRVGRPRENAANDATSESARGDKTTPDERRAVAAGNDARALDYEGVTRAVESWREELYMMNVKNSILLDDLVRLGANV